MASNPNDAHNYGLFRNLAMELEQTAINKYVSDPSTAPQVVAHLNSALSNLKSVKVGQTVTCESGYKYCPDSNECVLDSSNCPNAS